MRAFIIGMATLSVVAMASAASSDPLPRKEPRSVGNDCQAKCGIVPEPGASLILTQQVKPQVRTCFDKCIFASAKGGKKP